MAKLYSNIKRHYGLKKESWWLHNKLKDIENDAVRSPERMQTYERRTLRTIRLWQGFTLAFRIVLTALIITIPFILLFKRVTHKSWFKIDAVKKIKQEFKNPQPRLNPDPNSLPQIDSNNIVMGKKIGEGAHGVVHYALHHQRPVAVKIRKDAKKNRITREGMLLRCVESKYVIHCFGYFITPDKNVGIILEYMSGGNLETLLIGTEEKLSDISLNWRQQLAIAGEIAAGFDALHNAGIVHGDVKSSQILVMSQFDKIKKETIWHIKISDLDYAHTVTERRDMTGTPIWMAPELISALFYDEQHCTTIKTDIYGIGLIYWQLIAREDILPDLTLNTTQDYYDHIVCKNVRPKFNDKFKDHEGFAHLIQHCWLANPDERIRLPKIMSNLKELALENYERVVRTI